MYLLFVFLSNDSVNGLDLKFGGNFYVCFFFKKGLNNLNNEVERKIKFIYFICYVMIFEIKLYGIL